MVQRGDSQECTVFHKLKRSIELGLSSKIYGYKTASMYRGFAQEISMKSYFSMRRRGVACDPKLRWIGVRMPLIFMGCTILVSKVTFSHGRIGRWGMWESAWIGLLLTSLGGRNSPLFSSKTGILNILTVDQ